MTKFFVRKLLTLALFCSYYTLSAQNMQDSIAPKREMRGVWIATVLNIDYPSVSTTNDAVLQKTWVDMIDRYKTMGINALFVQIRPTADAFYPSALSPWSRYLTGQSGLAPQNDYDPLAFMVQTAHERGLEFHAWLNPYRATMDNQDASSFAQNHVLNAHPEWCVKYGKKYLLNPGIPDVRNHVTDVIREIVSRYNVDGIHFDDYFYPYPENGVPFDDFNTYNQYPNGAANLEDWRRTNVDILIAQVAQTIKSINPRVQFGISPFAVWRNQSRDPLGSATNALSCYDALYADVRKWLYENWIDYVVPQAYFNFGHARADYATVVSWWTTNCNNKPVYIGLGAHNVGKVWNADEMPRQIDFARQLENVEGFVFFSGKNLLANPLGLSDILQNNYFSSPALTPEIYRDTSMLACEPPEMRTITTENGFVTLRWQSSQRTQKRQPFQYLVYRFNGTNIDFTNGRNIVALVPHDAQELVFQDRYALNNRVYTYAVTVVDCYHYETPAADIQTVEKVDNYNVRAIGLPPLQTKSVKETKKRKGLFKN